MHFESLQCVCHAIRIIGSIVIYVLLSSHIKLREMSYQILKVLIAKTDRTRNLDTFFEICVLICVFDIFKKNLTHFVCLSCVSSLKFRNVLPALSVVLRRLHADAKSKRRLSLTWDWTLDTLAGHVRTLSPPDAPDSLESSEERLLLDSDPETLEVLQTVDVFTEFLVPLHEQIRVSWTFSTNYSIITVLLKFKLF